MNVTQSRRATAADGLVLIALCLGIWAGAVSRSVLVAPAAAALAAAVLLYGADRPGGPPPGRVAILAVASVLAWGTLGVGAAADEWPVAAVSLAAAGFLTWRLLGAVRAARGGV